MEIQVGDLVKLTGTSRHGKNRVREHGDVVQVLHVKGDEFCTKADDGYWRWIKKRDDQNFIWELISNEAV